MKRFLKFLCLVLVFAIGVFSLTGCGNSKKENTIVGKWQSKEYSSYVYTFNEDGTGDYSGSKFTYTIEDNKISILYENSSVPFESTYEIKDNKLNIIDSFGNDTIYIRK